MAAPHTLWALSSLTRDWTQAPAVKAQSPNHWTTREFPKIYFIFIHMYTISNVHSFVCIQFSIWYYFLQPEEFSLQFFVVQVCCWQILSLLFVRKGLFFFLQFLNSLICFKVKPKTHWLHRKSTEKCFSRLNTSFPLVSPNRVCTC